MPRRLDEAVTRIHIMLYQRDLDRIDKFFSNPLRPGVRSLKRSEAVRIIVGKFLDQVEAKSQQNIPSMPTESVEDVI